jgi:hypothetical protein
VYICGYAGLRPFVPVAEVLSVLDPMVNALGSLPEAALSIATRVSNFCALYFTAQPAIPTGEHLDSSRVSNS